jgi:hypothetical protein
VHAWIDAFGGSQGAVVYPQYVWTIVTPVGAFNGFGLAEVIPHEEFFTNHLMSFTPSSFKGFLSTRLPRAGLSFFQLGPRVNFTEAVPKLKKPMNQLYLAALPRFEGIRPQQSPASGCQ